MGQAFSEFKVKDTKTQVPAGQLHILQAGGGGAPPTHMKP
jgi:hypothetical protein